VTLPPEPPAPGAGFIAYALAVISRRASLLVTAVVLAISQAPAALASPADVAATRSYVQANYALVQYAAARLGAAEARLQGVLRRVGADCPNAAAGSPQNEESTMVSNEIIGAMVLATYHGALPQIGAFVRVASRLVWSNRALTRAVHAYAGKLRTLARLGPPDVCGDIKAWAANGYSRLPLSTLSFNALFVPAWVALGELPPQLGPYERPDERAIMQRSHQLESKLADFEAEAVQTYAKIMNAAAVNP
jgi:hypothetical protein